MYLGTIQQCILDFFCSVCLSDFSLLSLKFQLYISEFLRSVSRNFFVLIVSAIGPRNICDRFCLVVGEPIGTKRVVSLIPGVYQSNPYFKRMSVVSSIFTWLLILFFAQICSNLSYINSETHHWIIQDIYRQLYLEIDSYTVWKALRKSVMPMKFSHVGKVDWQSRAVWT